MLLLAVYKSRCRQWLIDNAYEDLEKRFSWPKLAQQTEAVYEKVMRERSQTIWL